MSLGLSNNSPLPMLRRPASEQTLTTALSTKRCFVAETLVYTILLEFSTFCIGK